MYIPCFLQVVFPYFVENKKIENKKDGKSPKIKIKALRKNNIPQRKKK